MAVKTTLLLLGSCLLVNSEKFSVTILNPDDEAGDIPTQGTRVDVHYRGTFLDGTEFDSSYDRKKPFKFIVGHGQAIQCWEDAFKQIHFGQKARVVCPPELAYGADGASDIIPANSVIIFELELLKEKVVEQRKPKWYDEDSNNWNDQEQRNDYPMEGNLSTHFCVNRFFPAILLVLFAASSLYLLYALAIPSIADPPRRRRKSKVSKVEVVTEKAKNDEGKKATKRKTAK